MSEKKLKYILYKIYSYYACIFNKQYLLVSFYVCSCVKTLANG